MSNYGNNNGKNDGYQNAELNQIALKFKKRRYDGGAEIDLIEQIEKQYHSNYVLGRVMAKTASQDMTSMLPSKQLGTAERRAQIRERIAQRRARRKAQKEFVSNQHSKKATFIALLVSGPLHILAGITGFATTMVAVVSLFGNENPLLKQQCNKVWKDSRTALWQGVVQTAFTPFNLVKCALMSA